jgi:hypothetical protein
MAGKGPVLSRRQMDQFIKCPRCFWLEKRHGVILPAGYPLALNQAMDTLLKQEFDLCRREGRPHPIQSQHVTALEDGTLDASPCGPVQARLFPEADRLQEWRSSRRGLRWTDPLTEFTLFGAVDDLFQFPDGSLAVVDYKSSGASQIKVYPSYRFQLEVYTFLLSRMGYATSEDGYLAFFVARKDDGFGGRLPFQGTLVRVKLKPERVVDLFREAAALAEADSAPLPGEECDLCRWNAEAEEALKRQPDELPRKSPERSGPS